MGIRDATAYDLDWLVEAGLEMQLESSFSYLTYDPDRVRSVLSGLIGTQYVRVYEKDGRIVAVMVGVATPAWFSQDMMATDLALFVEKKHRGSMAAIRLIRDFLRWAKDQGVKQIRPGVSTGAVGSAGSRLYEAIGFEAVGTTYVLNVR